ncbi:MAG: creatininase family protein, partial [Amnibacterium sp.]
SLRPETVTAIAVDLGRAAAASGARALVVVNGDWGNRAPLYTAVRRLQDEGVLPAIALDHPGLDAAAARLRRSRPAAPGLMHAEEIETSLLLAAAPEAVRAERPDAVHPDFPADFGVRPMRMRPFSPSGVFGDPGPARAELGRALLEAVLAESLRVLDPFLAALPAQPFT